MDETVDLKALADVADENFIEHDAALKAAIELRDRRREAYYTAVLAAGGLKPGDTIMRPHYTRNVRSEKPWRWVGHIRTSVNWRGVIVTEIFVAALNKDGSIAQNRNGDWLNADAVAKALP